MADYTSDRTGANIDTVLDNADAGNIGKTASSTISDFNSVTSNAFNAAPSGTTNQPIGGNNAVLTCFGSDAGKALQISALTDAPSNPRLNFRVKQTNYGAWQELYHTGNTGTLEFGGSSVVQSVDRINLTPSGTSALSLFENTSTTSRRVMMFLNPNGLVGTIETSGSATSYNTSSDPRLKDFKEAPTDAEVNAKFDDLFGCFKTFNWKSDADGELVWGFDAHATIDAGLDMGSEGEGSRDLALGDVYDTTPAELDEDGVEIKAAIEHKVTPAGVDQSKAVPILLAKIEQLERRLAKAGI